MPKEPLNRAQRRKLERTQKAHVPTFWDSIWNRIFVIALAAAFLGVVIYAYLPKSDETETATTRTTTGTTTTTTQPAQPATPPAQPAPAADPNAKVDIEMEKKGTGPTPKPGDRVTVHYTGTLPNGTKFDSSRDRGQPLTFTVGQGVIKGWSDAIQKLPEGSRAKLTIPPSLGYGAQDKGTIPPNSTLIFDIEVLKVESSSN